MQRPQLSPLLLGLLLLPGCPSSEPAATNPGVLYLANDMVETRVKLVDVEPHPF
jgi:hypothetical protein